jgi:hypothetical protein
MGLMPHAKFREVLHTVEDRVASGNPHHQNYAPPLETPH